MTAPDFCGSRTITTRSLIYLQANSAPRLQAGPEDLTADTSYRQNDCALVPGVSVCHWEDDELVALAVQKLAHEDVELVSM